MSNGGSIKLTDSRVRALKARASVYRVFDMLVPGFHVRVQPSGQKSYACQFQRKDGKKVPITLGYTDVSCVEEARETAAKLREIHDSGGDARAWMERERNAQDVNALVDYWREHYRHLLKPATRKSHDSIIKCHILPVFGSRFVKDLDTPSILAWFRKESKLHPIGANRTIEILSKLMSIAETAGWRPQKTNPCFKFPVNKEIPSERSFSSDELGRLGASIASLEAMGKLNPIAADLIRFLALSGLRRGEAENLKWADLDLEKNIMSFENHKTDGTMGTKRLPLNSQLRAILQRRSGQQLNQYVFPGWREGKPIQGLPDMWDRVLAYRGCNVQKATMNAFRHTFVTTSMELGYGLGIGDSLTGHSLGKIRDTYNNPSMTGILAKASEEISQWIASALRGESPKEGEKVETEKAEGA